MAARVLTAAEKARAASRLVPSLKPQLRHNPFPTTPLVSPPAPPLLRSLAARAPCLRGLEKNLDFSTAFASGAPGLRALQKMSLFRGAPLEKKAAFSTAAAKGSGERKKPACGTDAGENKKTDTDGDEDGADRRKKEAAGDTKTDACGSKKAASGAKGEHQAKEKACDTDAFCIEHLPGDAAGGSNKEATGGAEAKGEHQHKAKETASDIDAIFDNISTENFSAEHLPRVQNPTDAAGENKAKGEPGDADGHAEKVQPNDGEDDAERHKEDLIKRFKQTLQEHSEHQKERARSDRLFQTIIILGGVFEIILLGLAAVVFGGPFVFDLMESKIHDIIRGSR